VTNALLAIPGYELQPDLRVDRNDTTGGVGGGLLVYVRNGLTILPIDKVNNFNQFCGFKLSTKLVEYYIYLVYRPPAHNIPNRDLLLQVIESAGRNSIFIGDFNLPRIDWCYGTASGSDTMILDKLNDHGFEQLIDTPTHVKGNILDLVLTNAPERVQEVRTDGRLGKSDHEMIWVELEGDGEVNEKQVLPDWRKADWEAIREGLRAPDWEHELREKTADEAWNILREKLQRLQENHVPKKETRSARPPWMSDKILRLIRKKRKLWKKAKTDREKEEYQRRKKTEEYYQVSQKEV